MKTRRQKVCAAVVLFWHSSWSPEQISRYFSWKQERVEKFLEAMRELFEP